MGAQFECLLEYSYDVRTVGRRHEVKWASYFFYELVPARCDLLVHINFVSDHEARNVRTVTPHLFVPVLKVSVRYLALRIEDQNAYVRAEVVGWVQFVE